MKLKNDRFRKVRGGKAKVMDISCAKCGFMVFMYQKDGDGSLHRAYLNRIIAPAKLEDLNNRFQSIKEIQNLTCETCNNLIGVPMKHSDGRLAYRLIKANYTKKVSKTS